MTKDFRSRVGRLYVEKGLDVMLSTISLSKFREQGHYKLVELIRTYLFLEELLISQIEMEFLGEEGGVYVK